MQHARTAKVVPKIRQLARIARELHEGASFNIARLTTLKSLCEDATAAARFAMHLAQLTYRRMRDRACPAHLDPEKWAYSLQVVDESLRQMQRYLENPTEENADLVRAWLSDVRKLHDCYWRCSSVGANGFGTPRPIPGVSFGVTATLPIPR